VDLPAESEVLAQPTRSRLFSRLQELKRPVATGELAESLGMHVNGVRGHLKRLAEAGLVERRRAARGRGRPRDEWAIARAAAPGGEAPSAYADLARWLARAMPAGPGRLRAVERAGREIGRELTPKGVDGTAESFEQVFVALGFQPEMAADSGEGRACCRLCNCPYRDSVRENPEVVCTLHRGLTAGVLDVLAPGARLVTFEPHDPDLAGCLVEVADAGWSDPVGAG
jgi:predicted ArsR family transcriptional regulator